MLGCKGAARVDFRITPKGKPYVLEINTVPGMTETSLLPMAAGKAGISYDALTERILQSALARAGVGSFRAVEVGMALRWQRTARVKKDSPRPTRGRSLPSSATESARRAGTGRESGGGLLITLRVVGTVTVLVGGCSGLFVLARELGPLTREWFLVRSVSVNGLHHVTRKEVISRLALKPDTALYSMQSLMAGGRIGPIHGSRTRRWP